MPIADIAILALVANFPPMHRSVSPNVHFALKSRHWSASHASARTHAAQQNDRSIISTARKRNDLPIASREIDDKLEVGRLLDWYIFLASSQPKVTLTS